MVIVTHDDNNEEIKTERTKQLQEFHDKVIPELKDALCCILDKPIIANAQAARSIINFLDCLRSYAWDIVLINEKNMQDEERKQKLIEDIANLRLQYLD